MMFFQIVEERTSPYYYHRQVFRQALHIHFCDRKNGLLLHLINTLLSYINPRIMSVRLGYENVLYIFIQVGDGGDSYGIYLSAVDRVIKYTLED